LSRKVFGANTNPKQKQNKTRIDGIKSASSTSHSTPLYALQIASNDKSRYPTVAAVPAQ